MALKKNVHILFSVFRTKLNKAVNIFCTLSEIRNAQMIPGFSIRLGWERGWKSCMANSKDWRSENVNAIELNCNTHLNYDTSVYVKACAIFSQTNIKTK